NQRGIAAGIYATGPVTGMAITLATAAPVVLPLTGTWRGISLVYGAVVVTVLVLWLLLARNASPEARADGNSADDSAERGLAVLGVLLRIGNVRIVLVLGAAAFMLNHGLQNWLPTLLQEKGMTIERAGAW